METSVIVVHGVGDPLEGDALKNLIEGLTADQWEVVDPVRIEHRREYFTVDDQHDAVNRYPVARATLRSNDGQCTLRFHEVYWGDLSRPKSSLFGLVSALFDLIFGLRFVHLVQHTRL